MTTTTPPPDRTSTPSSADEASPPTGASPPPGGGDGPRRRPPGVSDEVVAACGKVSEAFEFLVRVRGHLYSVHQLTGHADLLFGEAADLLDEAGLGEDARRLRQDVVGRNVLDGRWTFQVVEEFDDLYYRPVEGVVRDLEQRHMDGRRHVFESEMKEERRTRGAPGHEARPPATYVAVGDDGDA